MKIPGFGEFEFDLPTALRNQLVDALSDLGSAPLDYAHVKRLPNSQGVYQIFHNKNLVYIGKTDSQAGLQLRLGRHATKIQQRLNLNPVEVEFKAMRVFVFTAMDLESELIQQYGHSTLSWNGSGFGSNDPGRERDTTRYKHDHFDSMYPIDIDKPVRFEIDPGEKKSAGEVLATLKKEVPYLIRYQTESESRYPHEDLRSTLVDMSDNLPWTVRSIICRVVQQLPPNWHATKLPGHIIIYKNDIRKFPSGDLIFRSMVP